MTDPAPTSPHVPPIGTPPPSGPPPGPRHPEPTGPSRHNAGGSWPSGPAPTGPSGSTGPGRAVAALVLLLALAACGPDLTECRDGTHTTTTGQGACSHHGGVKSPGRKP